MCNTLKLFLYLVQDRSNSTSCLFLGHALHHLILSRKPLYVLSM